jgi:hypothetical protein
VYAVVFVCHSQSFHIPANLHITTLGHGYSSPVHVPHDSVSVFGDLTHFNHAVAEMNLSHVITEFSFGPYFPDIAQPLDYSFELAKERAFTILACSSRRLTFFAY